MDYLTSLLTVINSFKCRVFGVKGMKNYAIIYFEPNKAELNQESKKAINDLIAVTPKDSFLEVFTEFDSKENVSVAQARGLSIVQYVNIQGGKIRQGCTMFRGERKATVGYE